MKEKWTYIVVAWTPEDAESKVFNNRKNAIIYLEYLRNYTEAQLFKGIELMQELMEEK